jgi:feruloyl esterase
MKVIRYSILTICLLLTSWSVAMSQDTVERDILALDLPGVLITVNESVPENTFVVPGRGQNPVELPAFRRIALIAKPVPASNIGIEIWLPEKGWNGRFLGTGNGGGAGAINYGSLVNGLRRGFAVANTDMGTSPSANEIIDYPERWKDFGYRATHEMTVIAKAVIEAFYKQAPRYSYFIGCSTGGQQAIMEAQRFPEDYDGIIAGAPANNRTHLHALFLWNHQVANACDCRFTPEQLTQITDEIIRSNAGKDGGLPTDDFLTDPRAATLDYDRLNSFLKKEQIEALKKVFTGPVNPVTGERIYTPFPLGSENQGSGLGYMQDVAVTNDQFYLFRWIWGRDFPFSRFDFNQDMTKTDSILAPLLNANNPDLEPFKRKGGKLLMYTGTADPIVPFQDAIHYYERVIEQQGSLQETQSFFRYFLVPGMAHCGGGPGVSDFGQELPKQPQDKEHDIMTTLIRWVEQGEAPEKLIATGYKENRTIRFERPLFPYPQFPAYTGGDPAAASSYQAVARKRGVATSTAPIYLK